MAEIAYSPQALADLERLEQAWPGAAATIARAVSILDENPFIGRSVEHRLRELVISRGKSGFIALYEHEAGLELVVILALRHQREAGYLED